MSNTQTSERTSFADEPPITHILLPKTAAVWYARPSKGSGSKPVSQRCRRESKRRRSGKNLSLLNTGGQIELLLALRCLVHLLQLHIHAHSPVPATDYIDVPLYNGRCGTCSLKELLVVDWNAFPKASSILGANQGSHLLLIKALFTQVDYDTFQSWMLMMGVSGIIERQ